MADNVSSNNKIQDYIRTNNTSVNKATKIKMKILVKNEHGLIALHLMCVSVVTIKSKWNEDTIRKLCY